MNLKIMNNLSLSLKKNRKKQMNRKMKIITVIMMKQKITVSIKTKREESMVRNFSELKIMKKT